MAEEWAPHAFDFFTADQLVDEDDLNPLNNSLRYLERVGYQAFTSTVDVTSTSSSSPTQIVALPSITYEAVPHWWEFACPQVNGVNTIQGHLQLWDDSSVVCRIQTEARITNSLNYGVQIGFEYTPPAATSVFSIRGYLSGAGTWSFQGGDGFNSPGATTNMPGFFRVTRVPV